MSKSKNRFSPFWKQCFVTSAVCSDVIGHGCIVGYPAVLLPQLKAHRSIPVTEDEASLIASVLGIAMLIGVFLTAPAMGKLGRKPAHYIVIVALLAAWFLFAFATSFTELLIGRILQGLSFGMFTPLRSVLIGEYTSPKNRGAFLAAISLAQGLGIMLVHLIGSLANWRMTALICTSFTFVSLLMTIYSPETPSWLADKGRFEESKRIFLWLRGHGENEELEAMIKARLDKEMPVKKYNLKEMYRTLLKKEFYKPNFIMCSTYLMISFSGAMTLAAFSTTIISDVIGPNLDPHKWMVALDTQRIFTSTLAIYIINKTKRRTMTFVTLGINIFCHVAIAGYVFAKNNNYMPFDSLWIPGILLLSHYLTVAFGMVPLPGVLAGEVFPLTYRSIGGSLSIGYYATFMFVALQTFSKLRDNIGLSGTYLFYAALLTYCFISLWWALPETKGRTLQEIENEYKGTSNPDKTESMPLKNDSEKINTEV